jgi:hypothetical protein
VVVVEKVAEEEMATKEQAKAAPRAACVVPGGEWQCRRVS